MNTNRLRHGQQGVALFTALIVMSLILLLAGTAARFTTTNVKMAVNEEIRVAARQSAQALVEATINDTQNIRVRGASGDAACTSGFPDPDGDLCTWSDLMLPSLLYDPSNDQQRVKIRVVRSTPELISPPRGLQTSIRAFDAAPFWVETQFDRRDQREGFAGIHEGVIVLVPKY